MSHIHLAAVAHSFLAISAGFVSMTALIAATTFTIEQIFPRFVGAEDSRRPTYLLLNLAYSLIFAATGGYVTAFAAKGDMLRHTMIFAVVVLLLSGLSALQLRGKQPVLYQLALTALSPAAALAGGLARMHQIGFRW